LEVAVTIISGERSGRDRHRRGGIGEVAERPIMLVRLCET